MKRIGITQRVVWVERIGERRDVLDQRWYEFAREAGIMLVPIPNNIESPAWYADVLNLEGIVFSGGNNVGLFGKELLEGKTIWDNDVAYERDLTEAALLEWAIETDRPVIGVCRGLQLMNAYFEGRQSPVSPEVHVAKQHNIEIEDGFFRQFYGTQAMVNSYHRWGILGEELAGPLIAEAYYDTNNVEAFRHQEHRLYGIMWHPERYRTFAYVDINFFKHVFEV